MLSVGCVVKWSVKIDKVTFYDTKKLKIYFYHYGCSYKILHNKLFITIFTHLWQEP